MAKKIARVVTANEELASIIDRGGFVDTEIKNLTVEDKGLKKRIADEAAATFEPGEASVRLEGTTTAALVSTSEKYEVDASAEKFPEADKAIRAGVFGAAVKVTKSLAVPPDKVEAAFAVLKQMGMDVMLETSVSVDPEEFRVLTGSTPSSVESKNAIEALRACVRRTTTSRVAYSRK